jgi:phosphoribosylpyrophosphate synthetase/non-canonical (house-cleaning) NTP pyrophosphatase
VLGTTLLFDSSTVYSNGKKTRFLIRECDLKVLQCADIVWLVDDVCESGNTLAALTKTLLEQHVVRDVRCIPFLLFADRLDKANKEYLESNNRLFPVCCYDETLKFVLPGQKVFHSPSLLMDLRSAVPAPDEKYICHYAVGAPFGAIKHLVYGPPSMNDLKLTFAEQRFAMIGDISWELFAGGMPNIHFQDPGENDVTFIFDANWADLNQIGIVHVLARNCKKKMTVIIPYFPQGTMERVDKEGVMATAQTTLHTLCSGMPLTGSGPVEIVIYDIHQTGTRFYAGDNVKFRPEQVLYRIATAPFRFTTSCYDKTNTPHFGDATYHMRLSDMDLKEAVIVFPDNGAASRFKHLFVEKQTCFVFSKIRQDGKRKITLSESIGPQKLEGSIAIIVDDLVRTGGTILETATIVRSMGAVKVIAAFVHADFDSGYTISFATDKRLDYISCSNSNPQKAAALKNAAPNKVLITGLFGSKEAETCALASISPEKLEGLRSVMHVLYHKGIWCGSVPSHVSEAPFNEEGREGAWNRLMGLSKLSTFKKIQCFSIESYLETRKYAAVSATNVDERIVDQQKVDKETVDKETEDDGDDQQVFECVQTFSLKIGTVTECVQKFEINVPDSIIEQSYLTRETIGEIMQKTHNLLGKSDWCYFFSKGNINRTQMVHKTLSLVHK